MMVMSLRLEREPHASQRPVSPPRLEMAAEGGSVGEVSISGVSRAGQWGAGDPRECGGCEWRRHAVAFCRLRA